MTFAHIHSPAKFSQKVDFSSFCTSSATDIDSIHDFNNKLWLVLEAKTVGTDILAGQHYLFQSLVQSLGKDRPTFAIVAHHDSDASSETITGDNLFVSKVYSSGPRVSGKVSIWDYGDSGKSTYNEFLSNLMLASDVGEKYFKHVELGGDMEAIEASGVFDFYPWDTAYNLAIARPDMLEKFARLDGVDWSDFDNEMETWLMTLGVNYNTLDTFVEKVFYRWIVSEELAQ